MTTRTLSIDDAAVVPWRNGGGTTRELLSWPPGADEFDWRVSIATIAADGPFSAFPGVDRVFTLIGGDGVRFRGSGLDRRVTALHRPFAFDGGMALDCTLLGEQCTALNVMSRRGRGSANVEIVTGPWTTPSIGYGMLLGLSGDWQVDNGSPGGHRLVPGTALWWAGESYRRRLRPRSNGDRIAVIGWTPVR